MHKIYILLIALLPFSGIKAQSCLPTGIWFSSQESIDNFQTNYPNCSEIEGNVEIQDGSDITNLNGLGVLTSIGGYLYVQNNPLLTSLDGLNNITSIGNTLNIDNNPLLTGLTGLSSLTSIGGTLEVVRNNSLNSLSGLENIVAESITGIYFFANSSLSVCNVKSVCDYIALPNAFIDIHENATGCNDQEEVEAACGVGIDESADGGQRSAVIIYPNPSSRQITISTPTTPEKNTFLTVININGQQLLTRQITEQQTVVDVAGLSQGVYFVRVTDESKVQGGKIIRQ